jgi:WD40 repeat protein
MRARLLPAALLLSALAFSWPGSAQEAAPADVTVLKGHREAVYGVAYTPDGKYLLTASGDPSIKVWDAASGKELKSFAGPNGHKQLVLAVAVSPDGATFATSGSDNTAKVWDFPTSKYLREWPWDGEATAVASSADGARVAAGGKDGRIKAFSAGDGKLLYDLPGAHSGPVTGLAFSANGQYLTSCGADGALRYWGASDGKRLTGLGAHSGPVSGVAINPNSNAVYTTGTDGLLRAWVMPPVAPKLLGSPDALARAFSLSPDASQVAVGVDKAVQIASVNNGALQRTLMGPGGPVTSVALTSGGGLVAGASGSDLFVWQGKDGALLQQQLAHAGGVNAVAFNAPGSQLLTAGQDGLVKAWALPVAPTRSFAHPDAVRTAVLSGDGKKLYTAGVDKTIRVWAVTNPKSPERQFTGHGGPVNAVAASPDGKFLVSGGEKGLLRFWATTKAEPVASIGAHEGPVVSLAFTATGQQVLSASRDGSVKLWQVPPPAGKSALVHSGAVTSVALSPDGARAVTGSDDKQARLWTLASGKMERALSGPTLTVTAVALVGDRVAAGSLDKSLWVWSASTGKEARKWVGLPAAVQAVALSPDGRFVAAGLADNSARLFDLTTGKESAKFTGHTGPVRAVLFNLKGDRVLSAGADGIVHLWEAKDGKAVANVKHGAAVHALALSKDGARFASGGADKAVRVWPTDAKADKPLVTITTPAEVLGLSWGPGGKRLAVAGADKQARTYGVDGALHEFLPHDGPVNAVAFTADGKRVLTGSADKTARTWPLSLVWQGRHSGAVEQAILSPRGDRVVSGGADKTVRLWNVADGKLVKSIAAEGAVAGVGISADGNKVASVGLDRKAHVWDLAAKVGKEGEKPAVTVALPADPLALAFSPNGQRLAVGLGGKGERVVVYDGTGRELLQVGESAPARALAFQADNRTLLLAGGDRTARLVDVNVLTAFEAHPGGATGVAFHNDGVRVLTGGADKTVKLWSLTTGKLERTFGPLAEPVQAVSFSRDGVQVAAAAGKAVRLWTTLDGKDVLTLDHPAAVSGLSYNVDRSRLFTAATDGRARIWDLNTKRELQSILHTGAVAGVAYHPSNTAQVFSAGADKGVWLNTLHVTRVIDGGAPLYGLAAAPNAVHVLTAGDDGKAKLWNMNTGTVERTFLVAEKGAREVAVSKNGLLVAASAADKRIRLFTFADAKLVVTLDAPAVPRALAFSPTSQALGAACADGSVKTWDVVFTPGQPVPAEFGKPLQSHAHEAEATALAFPANTGALFFTASRDKSVRMWKLASDAPTRNFPHPQSVNALAFDAKGERLATVCGDGRARVYDLVKGAVLKDIIAHTQKGETEIYCVAWSPDGKQIVTGSRDHSLKIWDVASGKLVRELKAFKEKAFEKGHQEAVLSAVFSPDGKQIVSGGMDQKIKVWNVADGSVVRDLVSPDWKPHAHPGWVFALRYTKDGKQLVSAGGAPGLKGYVAVWDADSGKFLTGRQLALGTIFSMALSPDGKTLALGTGGSVRSPELSQGVILKMPQVKGGP